MAPNIVARTADVEGAGTIIYYHQTKRLCILPINTIVTTKILLPLIEVYIADMATSKFSLFVRYA